MNDGSTCGPLPCGRWTLDEVACTATAARHPVQVRRALDRALTSRHAGEKLALLRASQAPAISQRQPLLRSGTEAQACLVELITHKCVVQLREQFVEGGGGFVAAQSSHTNQAGAPDATWWPREKEGVRLVLLTV